MALKKYQLVFQGQGVHFALLLFLIVGLGTVIQEKSFLAGELWRWPTDIWFWLAVVIPILHQTYVWLCWRLELHYGALSRVLGRWAFYGYAADFFLFLFFRLAAVCFLAYANQGSVFIDRTVAWGLIAFFGVPMVWVYYSIARYFGFRRAAGMDHFDPTYRTLPLAEEGIFKYFRNPIYLFGVLILFIPGLLLQSKAALLVAVFQYLYIWVHYFCTEKPDMRFIYGGSIR